MKRALLGVAAALVLATGNLASGLVPADAASDKGGPSAETQGLSLVICYYLPYLCR